MSAWSDAQAGIMATIRYADGLPSKLITTGAVIGSAVAPETDADGGVMLAAIFDLLGNDMRSAASGEDVPIEVIAAIIATEAADHVGVAASPTFRLELTGYVSDEETPTLVRAGCAGLVLSIAQAYGALDVTSLMTPFSALTAAARHIAATAQSTAYYPALVVAAYNLGDVQFSRESSWRMRNYDGDSTRIDRFLKHFNSALTLTLADAGLAGSAPNYATILAVYAPPLPEPAITPSEVYRKSESQAAVSAGVMVLSSNPELTATYALDDTTMEQLGSVARDSGAGLGLPMDLPYFAYPDKGGTPRVMNADEVQRLYRTMRDYIMAIRMYDVDQSPSLPGQPAFMG